MPESDDNIKNKMLVSRSGTTSHFVTAKPNGQYCCDNIARISCIIENFLSFLPAQHLRISRQTLQALTQTHKDFF